MPRCHLIHLGGYINDNLLSYIFLERFKLYMNIPMRKLKILSNFVYSGILQ